MLSSCIVADDSIRSVLAPTTPCITMNPLSQERMRRPEKDKAFWPCRPSLSLMTKARLALDRLIDLGCGRSNYCSDLEESPGRPGKNLGETRRTPKQFTCLKDGLWLREICKS